MICENCDYLFSSQLSTDSLGMGKYCHTATATPLWVCYMNMDGEVTFEK